jgi:hypothetical protein
MVSVHVEEVLRFYVFTQIAREQMFASLPYGYITGCGCMAKSRMRQSHLKWIFGDLWYNI